ncbi:MULTISPECIES: hypothetical protein [Bacillus]|uniref:hypothetical protein n=1 Tax=Bacillus TaxID=1386 RepID=UPI00027A3138|nr:hypothetical protein [Bacillus paranthracis]EJR42178.1 hypothetical protein IIK_05681 [Bacillus cereus VD102]MCC2441977.1 hypothetical protein [Bacillus paranthracis]MDG1603803.1 hypothetical protein [Bacillus paranthracis]
MEMSMFPSIPTFKLSELDGKNVVLKYGESTDGDMTHRTLWAIETNEQGERKAYLLIEK